MHSIGPPYAQFTCTGFLLSLQCHGSGAWVIMFGTWPFVVGGASWDTVSTCSALDSKQNSISITPSITTTPSRLHHHHIQTHLRIPSFVSIKGLWYFDPQHCKKKKKSFPRAEMIAIGNMSWSRGRH